MREKLDRSDKGGSEDGDGLRLVEPANTRAAVDSVAVTAIVVDSGEGAIVRALDTLHQQKFTDFETIVVQKTAGDRPKNSTVKRWPKAIFLQNQANLGFCRSCNLAAQMALGKYLLFLDNNAWLNQTALGKLVEALDTEPGAGIAGPLILNADGSLQSIGMNITQFGRPLANRRPFEANTDLIDNVFFVPGSVLLIEKQLFHSLNGFDELYVRGLEDADLCWRARLLGKKIVVNPWSIAYFDSGAGRPGEKYFEHRNSLRMILKNYGALKAFTGGAGFLGTTVVKSFKSLVSLKPQLFYEYWRALFWNLAMLPDSMRQRRRVQRRRRLNDKSVLPLILLDDTENSDFTSDRVA